MRNNFENKENGAKDTFETDSNSWIINIEATAEEGLSENMEIFPGMFIKKNSVKKMIKC